MTDKPPWMKTPLGYGLNKKTLAKKGGMKACDMKLRCSMLEGDVP